MNIEAYNLDSLRKLVRDLEKENKELRKLLDKAEIPYANKNTFSENIVDLEEYDLDQRSVEQGIEEISCFAVIDKELIWHGGVNLLGKDDFWDNLIRIKDYEVANELLEISFGS